MKDINTQLETQIPHYIFFIWIYRTHVYHSSLLEYIIMILMVFNAHVHDHVRSPQQHNAHDPKAQDQSRQPPQ